MEDFLVQSGQGVTDWPHRLGGGVCAAAPGGTWIVSTSDDKTVRIWDTTSGQPVGTA